MSLLPMAASHARLPTPETLCLVWQLGWAVGGAATLWRLRPALRRETDGRVGWTGKPSGAVAFFAIYALAWITMAGIAFAIASEAKRLAPDLPGFGDAIFVLLNPALMAGVLLVLRRYTPEFSPQRPHRVKPRGAFGFTPSGLLKGFAAGMAVVVGSSLLWGAALLLVKKAGWGDFTDKQKVVMMIAGAGDARVIVPFLLGTVIFAPVHEELFYRAGVFALLRGLTPRFFAYAACGIVFGLVHGNVAGFMPLALFGAWLAWLYDMTADLRVPITIHALFNLSSVVWLILAPGAAGL